MKINQSFLSRVVASVWFNIFLLAAPAYAGTFTATFTNQAGSGIWEKDAHIGVAGNPNDPSTPGNWDTGAYPSNGHIIFNPNTNSNVPGDNPFYNVLVNLNGCKLGTGVTIETLNVASGVNLNIAPSGVLAIANGQITNNGTITVSDGTLHPGFSDPILRFDSLNSQVTGNGSINLRGVKDHFGIASINISGNATRTLVNGASHLIHGLGLIDGFNGGSIFINNGTINADDPTGGSLFLGLSYFATVPQNKNNGLIEASGGGVILFSGIIDQTGGGTFLADGNGSIVQFGNGDQNRFSVVIGGTLNTSNNGLLRTTPNGQGVTLTGCTNNGSFQVPAGNNPLLIRGTGLTNNGAILVNPTDPVNSTSIIRFDESGTLGGTGTVTLNGIGFNRANLSFSGGSTLTIGANQTVRGRGTILGDGLLINNGTIIGDDVAGNSVQIDFVYNDGVLHKNNGVFKAINGGMLGLYSGIIDQTGGGSFLADGAGSIVQIGGSNNGGVVGATVIGGTLNTTNGGVIQIVGGNNALLSGTTNNGAIQIPAGETLFVKGTGITNNGTILVDTTAANTVTKVRFEADGTLGGTGSLTLNGILNTFNVASLDCGGHNVINGAGHTIKGNGDIFTSGGLFTNNGTISPGFSPGKISISGNYVQGSTGVLNLEIGGKTPATEYDQLVVTGAATLAGTLNLTLIDGYRPKVGDVFQIISFGSFTGAFSTINFTGFTAQVTYGPTGITFKVLTVPDIPLNIATRLLVNPDPNQLIGGFIITGTQPKKVIIRGIAPSLASFFSGVLADPTMELYQGSTLLVSNDNWKVRASDGTSQQAEVEATTVPPSNDLESAIVATLAPGPYTAVLRGKGGTSGIAVIEAYDLDQNAKSKLANIATRGLVGTNENVMIGGFIMGGNGQADGKVVIRAIGPSLAAFGIANVLQDPFLELHNANGTTIQANDDWQQTQATEISQTGLAPTDVRESAMVTTLPDGNYTAIVRGKNNATGVAVVEVYSLL
jgi:hypothetical protein